MVDPIPVVTYPGLTPITIGGFPLSSDPYTNIVAATYRDGTTLVKQLEELSCWVSNDLVDQINTNETALQAAWDAEVAALVTAINNAINTAQTDNHTDYENLVTQVNAAIANLNTVASQVQAQVDAASGSATAASNSATAASGSATAASGSATAASTSATNAATSATNAATSATQAGNAVSGMTPIGVKELGPRIAVLSGDQMFSATQSGNTANGPRFFAGASAIGAFAALSLGKARVTLNRAVANDTVANMVTRFTNDIGNNASKFDTLIFIPGTADYATTFSNFQASVRTIVNNTRLLNKAIVIGTLPPPPTAANDARKAAVVKINLWLKRYAASVKVPIVNLYRDCVDNATGGWNATYSNDAITPNAGGAILMGYAILNAITSLFAPASLPSPDDSYDLNNLIKNGTFGNWSNTLGTALPAPSLLVQASQGTGTGLTAGTYYYMYTFLSAWGETLPSAEASLTVTADQRIQVTMPTNANAQGYRLYVSKTPGAASKGMVQEAAGSGAAGYSWVDAKGVPLSGAINGNFVPPAQDGSGGPLNWGITMSDVRGPELLTKVTGDAAFPGAAVRVNQTTALSVNGPSISGVPGVSQSVPVVAGNKLGVIARARSNNAIATPTITVAFYNTTTNPVSGGNPVQNTYDSVGQSENYGLAGTFDQVSTGTFLYYDEITVPVGATIALVSLTASFYPTGVAASVDFGQVGVYDLTALGIDPA